MFVGFKNIQNEQWKGELGMTCKEGTREYLSNGHTIIDTHEIWFIFIFFFWNTFLCGWYNRRTWVLKYTETLPLTNFLHFPKIICSPLKIKSFWSQIQNQSKTHLEKIRTESCLRVKDNELSKPNWWRADGLNVKPKS